MHRRLWLVLYRERSGSKEQRTIAAGSPGEAMGLLLMAKPYVDCQSITVEPYRELAVWR